MLVQSSLLCMLLLALSWNRAASLMPLETQEDYLNHLYLQVKDRPLRNGELNLLPDEIEPGFANTVRCVPETEGGNTHAGSSRKMNFQRAMLKASEDVICAKLVINLPAGFSEEGEVTLYESSDTDEHHRQLDKASVPSCRSTCWFELKVGEDMADNMELLLEFTHTNREFIERLNPMIVLYTYVEQSLPNFVTKRLALKSVGTRAQEEEENEETHENQLLSDLDSTGDPCGKQTLQLEYSQLKWLGEDVTLISPTTVEFDFCYGHCNIPVNVLPQNDDEQGFDKRARILEIMNRLSEDRLTPPPCCIPLSYIADEIIFAVGELATMTTFPSVEQCGCRA